MDILASDAPTLFYLFNRHGLHTGMDACLITMHIKADDILFSPFLTCTAVGVQCPVLAAFCYCHLAGVRSWFFRVDFLFTKGKPVKHIMVTTEDDADSAVRTVA